jgi:hypothetical protein
MFFYNVLLANLKLLVDPFLLASVRLKDKLGLNIAKKNYPLQLFNLIVSFFVHINGVKNQYYFFFQTHGKKTKWRS